MTLDEALEAHDQVLSRFGGRRGIISREMVESALARPYSGYYKKIEEKGAALVHSLALNHGFTDGNKRTAVFMLAVLLLNSGYSLKLNRPNAEVEEMISAIANHILDFDDVVLWLRKRLVRHG